MQPGYTKLGLKDGGSGRYQGTFPCFGKVCKIDISGYSHTRGRYAAVVKGGAYSKMSNLLRSSFLRNSPGVIHVVISGLQPTTVYKMVTYHHSTSYARRGAEFTLKYSGNPLHKLKESANGNNPNPPLIHKETVKSDAGGKIVFDMKKLSGTSHMDLNGLHIHYTPQGMFDLIFYLIYYGTMVQIFLLRFDTCLD